MDKYQSIPLMDNVLIIDDENELRGLLKKLLQLEGYKITEASDAKDGISKFEKEEFDVVITDVRLPDVSGLDLVVRFKEMNSLCEVIVLTAYGTIEDGVEAIKRGAFDYITKGDEDNRIVPIVNRALEKSRLSKKVALLEEKVGEKYGFENIIGNSTILKEAVDNARKVAVTDTPVLLLGETGTGKELFAHAIHYASGRGDKPFVIVNCSAIPKDLLESEMFGYKAGAFTGAVKNKKGLWEEADSGTLFLDEIGEMDLSLQAKILRAVETNSFTKTGDTKPISVNVRIIAATNKNLEKEIESNNFRADLYYRISVIKIELPSLRSRKEDVPLLAESFIKFFAKKMNKKIYKIEREFMKRLENYKFPGNIRELKNLMERAVILSENGIICESLLPRESFSESRGSENKSVTLEDVEKDHILKILQNVKGNKTKAAEILGIGLTTLYRKLQSYGIE